MVLKRWPEDEDVRFLFENDVKTYGTQTLTANGTRTRTFENDVKTYGTQTAQRWIVTSAGFENDVKTYGTQTLFSISPA